MTLAVSVRLLINPLTTQQLVGGVYVVVNLFRFTKIPVERLSLRLALCLKAADQVFVKKPSKKKMSMNEMTDSLTNSFEKAQSWAANQTLDPIEIEIQSIMHYRVWAMPMTVGCLILLINFLG